MPVFLMTGQTAKPAGWTGMCELTGELATQPVESTRSGHSVQVAA
jgi:hypothetical protein